MRGSNYISRIGYVSWNARKRYKRTEKKIEGRERENNEFALGLRNDRVGSGATPMIRRLGMG